MNSEWVQHQAPAELALSGIETPFQPARVFDVALHTPHERLVSSLRSDNMADAVQFVWCSVTSWMCMVSLPVHDPATGKVGRGALSEFSLDSWCVLKTAHICRLQRVLCLLLNAVHTASLRQ